MGYISLLLNLTFLIYIGPFAAIPLVYLVHSFRPILPWSCEASELWTSEYSDDSYRKICNSTGWQDDSANYNDFYKIPSVLFFRSLFSSHKSIYETSPLSWSLQLIFAIFVVWTLIAIFFYKNNIKRMSLFIRYTLWIIVLLLLICLIRLTFLESSKDALWQYIYPQWKKLFEGLILAPIYASAAFGAGWGAIISLSSYNKFNTNIMRYSWLACVGQLLVFMLYGLVVNLIDSNLEKLAGFGYYYHIEENWILYLTSGWVMSNLKFPNIWCILFFSTLTLSALLMMTIQLFSILTTVFDEFERLRDHKQKVTFGLIGLMFLNSIYFCSNHGLKVINVLSYDVIFSQTLLNLLLLLIVLWIYGRERFQWDFQFMLRQTFPTWRVHMLRFVAAAAMLYTLVFSAKALVVFLIALFAIFLPWLFLPGYAQWRMSRVKGSFRLRFKRCCQPADWYPVEVDNHQRYKDLIKNANVLLPLSAAGDRVSEI